MTVRPIFAWYDFWVGVYYDRGKLGRGKSVYIFLVPMFGIVIEWG